MSTLTCGYQTQSSSAVHCKACTPLVATNLKVVGIEMIQGKGRVIADFPLQPYIK
jgi:hypothetical protein